ncbi:hypothetical protein [Micrococcoides hystricis]|uniref:Uncharacterized protein n=1 Tax=Micrococcoides hystricis TaxID=1572761 RepID=A0ABV6P801_9MICC
MTDQNPETNSNVAEVLARAGEPVIVRISNGAELTGWAVREDMVVVEATNLGEDVSVHLVDADLVVEEVHDGSIDRELLTALLLPKGALPISGELLTPTMIVRALQDPDWAGNVHGARTSFWCLIFPRMRGCY